MATEVPEIQAALLAKQLQRTTAAKEVLASEQKLARLPSTLVITLGTVLVGGYGHEVAAYLGTSRNVLLLLLTLICAVAVLATEVAVTRRRLNALISLVGREERGA